MTRVLSVKYVIPKIFHHGHILAATTASVPPKRHITVFQFKHQFKPVI